MQIFPHREDAASAKEAGNNRDRTTHMHTTILGFYEFLPLLRILSDCTDWQSLETALHFQDPRN